MRCWTCTEASSVSYTWGSPAPFCDPSGPVVGPEPKGSAHAGHPGAQKAEVSYQAGSTRCWLTCSLKSWSVMSFRLMSTLK